MELAPDVKAWLEETAAAIRRKTGTASTLSGLLRAVVGA